MSTGRVPFELVIPYRWSYGGPLTRFFEETKRNRRFVGARCTKCRCTLVPPPVVCGRCFAPLEKDLVPVSDQGRLETWTTVRFSYPGQPAEPPYTLGLIVLDGASNYFPHLVKEVEPENIRADMRVQAVWNPAPQGDLLDILYFRPL